MSALAPGQKQTQQHPLPASTVSLSPSTVSAVSAAQYGQIPPQNAGMGAIAANVARSNNDIAPETNQFNTRADALAWEIREARLEEELDRAHTKLEEMGNLLVRKDNEIACARGCNSSPPTSSRGSTRTTGAEGIFCVAELSITEIRRLRRRSGLLSVASSLYERATKRKMKLPKGRV